VRVHPDAAIVIDNDVILDGEGALILDGKDVDPMLQVTAESAAELRRLELTDGGADAEQNVVNSGVLTLTKCALSNRGIDNLGGSLIDGDCRQDSVGIKSFDHNIESPGNTCSFDQTQRGESRPETGGTLCDVGAFEVQP
jgi:hypothetical protein